MEKKRMRWHMTETIYEQRIITEAPGKEFVYPSNRRQIGRPGDSGTELFIEDYALSFAKGLAEKDYSGCVAGVLVGSTVSAENGERIRIEGLVEAKNVMLRDQVCFTEENWAEIYRDIRDYFPKLQIVGWFLGGPGFLLEDEGRQKKIQTDNFGGGDKILLKVDSIEREVSFLSMINGRMLPLPGYYVYYEKNEGMQNYMMQTRQQVAKLPEYTEAPVVPKSRREEVVGRTVLTGNQLYRLLYATGGVLACLAVFAIGALAVEINEREYLKTLLNEQEQVVSSLCEVYEVKDGETIETICTSVYGSEELAEIIRTLNGLREGENPEVGQKIFLP